MTAQNSNLYTVFRQYFPADSDTVFARDINDRVLTYGQLEAGSAQLANWFVAMGIQRGDRIAVQVEKSFEALLVYLAAVRAGFVYLPLNTSYTDSELEYFFGDASPALVIGDPRKRDTLQGLIANPATRLETLAADGSGSLMESAASRASQFEDPVLGAGQLAAILYTSGTTGRPKGAMLSHGNLLANAMTLKALWGFTADDVLLHALPLFHVHGLFVACHCVLAAGASMLFLPKPEVELLERYLPQSTVMMGVPTFYTRLLNDETFGAQHCGNMRLFISGSAPLLESTHRAFEQRSGHRILERYGMSETGMLVSNPLQGERRAGTVGLPLPDVEVRIVDDNNQSLASGEVGSIQVKGPNVFQGYWQMPDKTRQEFTDDGFFITGDLGTASDDGYISIVGRSKDLIISGGYNVYPREVESVIDKLDGVKESAVIGLQDKDLGEKVAAVVVPDGSCNIDAQALQDAVREKLAAYKLPRTIVFVDELPRNTMGKVQKNVLRERYDPPTP